MRTLHSTPADMNTLSDRLYAINGSPQDEEEEDLANFSRHRRVRLVLSYDCSDESYSFLCLVE
jgi:hypothetical protein